MTREEVAPVILSASRSTDIPAFYAKWFFDRLAEGYCVWTNPFNQQKMILCLDESVQSAENVCLVQTM